MPWVRFDDQSPQHPKLVGLSDAATATWFRSICWSSQFLMDGHVPFDVLPLIVRTNRARVVAELVDSGLWHQNGNGGYVIHDYHRYQPSKAQVQAERDGWRKRQEKAREHRRAQ